MAGQVAGLANGPGFSQDRYRHLAATEIERVPVIKRVVAPASWILSGILLLFVVRRWLFTLVALVPERAPLQRSSVERHSMPDVLLLVPVRNEVETLPEFLSGLTALDYPAECLSLVVIDDG